MLTCHQEAPSTALVAKILAQHDMRKLLAFEFREFQQPIAVQYVTVASYALTVLGYPSSVSGLFGAAGLSLLELTRCVLHLA